MSFVPPSERELKSLLGASLFEIWHNLCRFIDNRYDMDRMWGSGGKKWTYEYKYRRGGRTLCALYASENHIGFMIILGAAEREKFEARRFEFTYELQKSYDEAATYHDGKWIMLLPEDTSLFGDIEKLLEIKRKPNIKA